DAGLRSEEPRATDSSLACASAPSGADATAVAVDHGSLHPAPRYVESDSPTATAVSVAHPDNPSFACALAWCGSRRHLRSTTQTPTRAADARTSASAHSTPFPLVPLDFPASVPGRTAPPARDALGAVRSVLPCRYRRKQFVGSPDENHTL